MKRNESTRPRGPDAGVDNHGQLWEDRDAPSHAPPRDLARGPGVVKTPGPYPPAPSAGPLYLRSALDRKAPRTSVPYPEFRAFARSPTSGGGPGNGRCWRAADALRRRRARRLRADSRGGQADRVELGAGAPLDLPGLRGDDAHARGLAAMWAVRVQGGDVGPTMPRHPAHSEVPAESVRTLLARESRWCPVCEATRLRGRQTVCSPGCRRERRRQAEARAAWLRTWAVRASAALGIV